MEQAEASGRPFRYLPGDVLVTQSGNAKFIIDTAGRRLYFMIEQSAGPLHIHTYISLPKFDQ